MTSGMGVEATMKTTTKKTEAVAPSSVLAPTKRCTSYDLRGTSMRSDWLSAIETKWPTGLPCDREGHNFLYDLTRNVECDALDILWVFELLSPYAALSLTQQQLGISPFGKTFIGDVELHPEGDGTTLTALQLEFGAAELALTRVGADLTARLSASAYKHYVTALLADRYASRASRAKIHCAKSAAASLALKTATIPEAPLRLNVIASFWEAALNALSDDIRSTVGIDEDIPF